LAGNRASIAQEAAATDGSAVVSKGLQTPAVVPAIRDWSPQALDALFGVVQDATANRQVRRKAALKIAEFLLPKVGKKAKVIPDEYGFSINPNLASAYRETERELRALVSKPARKIPAIAERIKKLEARSDAIRRRLQVPCPTKYGHKEAAKDLARLIEFASLREDGTALTEAQKAEEAHLRARSRCVLFKSGGNRAPPARGAGGRGTAVQKKSIIWRFPRGTALAKRAKRP
jgi:hypothetical protein